MHNGKDAAANGEGMLPSNFFNNLLALEEQMVSHTFTVDTINNLVTQYAKCIEFYDLRKDPIKHYFMEKIQMTLANKDALKVMMESKKKAGDRRSSGIKKPPPPAIQERVDEEEDEEKANKKKKSPRTSTNGRKKSGDEGKSPKNGEYKSPRGSFEGKRYSLTDKKKERARQISYMLKIENIKSNVAAAAADGQSSAENIIIDLTTIVSNYKKISEQNDTAVRQELADQEKAFKAKLDTKRKSHHWNKLKSRTSSFSEELPMTMLRSASATSVLLPIRVNKENEDTVPVHNEV